MNMDWKYLVTKNNNRIIFGMVAVFARSCFAAVLITTALFADPVAARKTANPNDLKVFFPQKPRPTSLDEAYKTPFALGGGRLVLKNDCLRVQSNKTDKGTLLIWPGRYGFEIKGHTIIIKDVYAGYEPEVRIKLNSEVILTGGGLPDDFVFDASTLVKPLPKDCTGPYWSVGGIELEHKGKKRDKH
jgi:hypothetical protein